MLVTYTKALSKVVKNVDSGPGGLGSGGLRRGLAVSVTWAASFISLSLSVFVCKVMMKLIPAS